VSWLESGAHIKAVADLLGNSSIAITGDVYGHTSDDIARAAVDGRATRIATAGYFEPDGPFLHIGPEAERRFGRRYFSDLTAVFTAPPEFLVLAGMGSHLGMLLRGCGWNTGAIGTVRTGAMARPAGIA
jgi:hypothetical protein